MPEFSGNIQGFDCGRHLRKAVKAKHGDALMRQRRALGPLAGERIEQFLAEYRVGVFAAEAEFDFASFG